MSFDFTILQDLIFTIPFISGYIKPKAYTNMQSFQRALLRSDVYNEQASEMRLYEDYRDKLAKEQTNSLFAEFAGSLVSSAIGFLTYGPTGAKMGWKAGKALGRNLRKLDGAYFDAQEFLNKNKFKFSGKFYKEEGKKVFNQSLRDVKDVESIAMFTDVMNLGSAAWMGFSEDWSDFDVKKWRETKMLGKGGKLRQLVDSYKKDKFDDFKKMLKDQNIDMDDVEIEEVIEKEIEKVTTDIANNPDKILPETITGKKNKVAASINEEYPDIDIVKEVDNVKKGLFDRITLEEPKTKNLIMDSLDTLEEINVDETPFETISLDSIKDMVQKGQEARGSLRLDIPVESEDVNLDMPLPEITETELEELAPFIGQYEPGGVNESKRYMFDSNNQTFIDQLNNKEVPIEEWYSTPQISDQIKRAMNIRDNSSFDGVFNAMDEFEKGPFSAKQYFDVQNFNDPNAEFAKNMNEVYRKDYGPRFWDGTKELYPEDEGLFTKSNLENLAPQSPLLNNEAVIDSLDSLYDFRVPVFDGEEIYGLKDILDQSGVQDAYLTVDIIQDAIDYYVDYPNDTPPEELKINPSIWNWLTNINAGGQ